MNSKNLSGIATVKRMKLGNTNGKQITTLATTIWQYAVTNNTDENGVNKQNTRTHTKHSEK